MKKILSVIIVILTVFSLVSCASGGEETTTDAGEDSSIRPVVSLVSQKTAVKPGEEINVKIHISDAPMTACFDVCVYGDELLQYANVVTFPSQLILAANNEKTETEEYVIVRGIVAATCDVIDDDICEITYRVSKDAPQGAKINLTVRIPVYQVGMDVSGDDILSVSCETKGLVLEVI